MSTFDTGEEPSVLVAYPSEGTTEFVIDSICE
jgi:hypothetical protein